MAGNMNLPKDKIHITYMNLFSLKLYALILDIYMCASQCFSEMNLHCVKYCVKVLKLINNQASYFL